MKQSINEGYKVGDRVYIGSGNHTPGRVVDPEHTDSSGVWVWPDNRQFPSCYAYCNVKLLRVHRWK